MTNNISYILFIIFVLAFIGCNSNEPEENSKLNLSVEDVSCTEVWLKISDAKGSLITLKRDGKEILQFKLAGNDTIIVDNALLPNKTYNYQAFRIQYLASSISVPVTTMDTTSHNFTWQTYIFGEPAAGSSYLNDISIINENNMWLSGNIFTFDTLGQVDYKVNALQWNGEQWILHKVSATYHGNTINPSFYGIFAFNDTIWFSSGIPLKGDGKKWIQYHLFDMGVLDNNDGYLTKIWGSSSFDLYYVGTLGTIVHKLNSTWQKIESGTELYLSDIYGKDENVFICASDGNNDGGLVLKKNGQKFEKLAESKVIPVSQIFNPYLFGPIGSLWIDEKDNLYVVGYLLYKYKFGKWEHLKGLKGNSAYENMNAEYRGYITGIRGNSSNDFFVCGERNTLLHFNGYSWQQIGYPYNPQSDITWYAIESKGNSVVAVGKIGRQAIIMMLKRN